MAENPTHLEIFKGKILSLRVLDAAPTSPAPEPGDMYIDNNSGREAIGIRNQSSWLYISLTM